jgi:bifunctional non-homologous end joining protein LigD
MSRPARERDTSIQTYRARRNFGSTPEPAPAAQNRQRQQTIFVVQKHAARRLHWDFRLEHGGVLWSWAVPKGPSLDPADKRLAVRTEDHPLEYAEFSGTIPAGEYGAGTVETWDRGTWQPKDEPEAALAKGELKFTLTGARLNGGFVLVRLKPRATERAENWLLIKEHDQHEARGIDAKQLEDTTPPPRRDAGALAAQKERPPAPQAVRGPPSDDPRPQLASPIDAPPSSDGWLSEFKFDGYRLLASKNGDEVRLLTRNGHDWTARLPTIARAVAQLAASTALLDGELVAMSEGGVSSFPLLQQALSDGADGKLLYYLFDLLYLDGWDLSGCRLIDRKEALAKLDDWPDVLRYSDHVRGDIEAVRQQACAMGLEGIICKQEAAPYRPGRGRSWLKVKCTGREEFVVIGFTPPAGSRIGIGSLHLGYYDAERNLHYVGGVGTGFADPELARLRERLDALAADPPGHLLYAGEKPDTAITWVRPELIAEVRFAGWSGSGRIRHATYLGLREDKSAAEVVQPVHDPEAKRVTLKARRSAIVRAAAPKTASNPSGSKPPPSKPPGSSKAVSAARRPERSAPRDSETLEGVRITHAARELWPGISKRDLAAYWIAVAKFALPELGGRPLALVRCPEGFAGERFFQKHGKPGFPAQIRGGHVGPAPYLVIDDLPGLIACAQVAAIELHAWGSRESDGEHPDRLVFDLDPGDGVSFAEVVRAAFEVRQRLQAVGIESFCRTTGGKGLHVVASVRPRADWTATRAWCRAFAEAMVADSPGRYVSRLAKVERRDRILVDWLRNGLGSTAVASFSPRARAGATVATPVGWREVTDTLDPTGFTLATVPARLKKRADPWPGFGEMEQYVPDATKKAPATKRRR